MRFRLGGRSSTKAADITMTGLILGWDKPLSQQPVGFAFTPERHSSERSLVTDEGEGHLLAIGRTGSGKGRSVIMPIMLTYGGSVIIIDVKGEAAAVSKRRRKEMGQEVIILEPYAKQSSAAAFNPLSTISCHPDELADAAMVIAELICGNSSLREPFWDELSKQLLAALIVFHATHKDESEQCLSAVWNTLMNDDFRYHLALLLDGNEGPLHPFAHQQFAGFLQADERNVQTSVRSTAQQHMRVFGSKQIAAATRKTTFSLDALRTGEPMTIYIVVPPDKLDSAAPLLRIWISSLMSELARREKQPEIPTLFVIDELAAIGPMAAVKRAVALLRGYGVRCALFLQTMAQLKGMWPQDYETIIDNCEILSVLGAPNLGAARQLEAILGDISADALLTLPSTDLALSRAGKPTRIVQRLDYLRDAMFQGKYDQNPFYRR